MIVRSATNKPKTSDQNIANELLSSCNVSVSAHTVRNVLHSAGLKARTPRKKPYISEVNRKRRLEFAMKYKNKSKEFWKKVIYSDENKFEIFTPPSIRKIWRKNKTALEPKNVLPTLKHGGGNVMVWGCVAHNGADSRLNNAFKLCQNEIAVVPDFHKRILFSDEAHFWLNGYVNKQNCRIWSEANLQVYVETPLHPEKLTVWCALWVGGIIGPYFFKNDEGHNVTVNGDRYRAIITNFFSFLN
ncbi:transposable element Tcb2 transposase [Trichonephila clavipes]|nr:transposable element Tcb2 transposase [Trichonephila clavipes]